jgi:hypothetical protein
MRSAKIVLIVLAVTTVLLAAGTMVLFNGTELTSGIPTAFDSSQSAFQQQTHFLVFTGSDTPGENAATATAYYNAIDPNHTKRTFPEWLVKAGFIKNTGQWHPTGPQLIACDLGPADGCDMPAHNPDGSLVYGDNVINTDSHAIVLNAADLGFVRNQFVRCVPSCTAPNPIVYTYLENYPVNPFAAKGNGGSGFPAFSGYPSTAEAAVAIQSALTRPAGKLTTNPLNGQKCNDDKTAGPVTTDTAFGCKISRIADVAFEWAPPPTNLSSSTRYGQLYAYFFVDGAPPTETIAQPASTVTPNVATHTLQPVKGGLTADPVPANNNAYTGVTGDPFPPNLDFIGNKQHPGVCLICHGGKPSNLTSTGAYPHQGNISGFRFLPLDIRNLLFTSDNGGDQPALGLLSSPFGSVAYTDRGHQELQIKKYNQAVLLTVPTDKENDGTGSTRVAHLRDVIIGWYAGFSGDQTMSSNVQNQFWQTKYGRDYIPQGWLEAKDGGTAPTGSEHLYLTVLSPSCRSCHFNRETSLDFGTAANFMQESDILQLALIAQCKNGNPDPPDPNAKFMPLAHLTYQRYWQANASTGGGTQTLPYPAPGLNISNTADQIASYFGFGSVAGYCATGP